MSNKDQRCIICKYKSNVVESPAVYSGKFFDESGKEIRVLLCKFHDRELFVKGQFHFLQQYQNITKNVLGADDDINVLENLINIFRKAKAQKDKIQFRRAY